MKLREYVKAIHEVLSEMTVSEITFEIPVNEKLELDDESNNIVTFTIIKDGN